MKRRVLLVFLTILIGFFLIISTLFIPSVTTWVSQKVLTHYLDANLSVREARLTLSDYTLKSTSTDNAFLNVLTTYSFGGTYAIDIDFGGNVNAFSTLAGMTLPQLELKAVARYTSDGNYKLDADVLDGNLSLAGNVVSQRYKLQASKLNLGTFFNQQKELPEYLSGTVDIQSGGTYKDSLDINLSLNSHQMYLQAPLVQHLSDTLVAPIPTKLTINSNLDDDWLNVEMKLATALVDLKSGNFKFNTASKEYEVDFKLVNKQADKIDVKTLALHANGFYKESGLEGSGVLKSDRFKLEINALKFNDKEQKKYAQFVFSSLDENLVALMDEQALEGEVLVLKDKIHSKFKLPSWKNYAKLEYENKKASLSAQNISLSSIQNVIKIPVMARGSINLNAKVDLQGLIPQYKVELTSENTELNSTLKNMTQIHQAMTLSVTLHNEDKAIVINPELKSERFILLPRTQLKILPKHSKLDFNMVFKDVNYKMYSSKQLQAKGTFDFRDILQLQADIKSDFEAVNLALEKEEDTVVDANVSIKHLERFASLAPTYEIDAQVHLENGKTLRIDVHDTNLGTHKISRDNRDRLHIRSTQVPLRELQKLVGIDSYLKGDISLEGMYDKGGIDLNLETPQLESVSQKLPLHTTPLKVTLHLDKHNTFYSGKAKIDTKNESLTMRLKRLSSQLPYLKSAFSLDIANLSNISYPLDIPSNASLSIENGEVVFAKKKSLHAEVAHFMLDKQWHQKIDKSAKTGLKIAMKLDFEQELDRLQVHSNLDASLLSIPFIDIDANVTSGIYRLQTKLKTPKYPSDVDISAGGNYVHKTLEHINIKAQYEHLKVKEVDYNPNHYKAKYQLTLKETPIDYDVFHHEANVYGYISSNPVTRLYVNTQSFDGEINASVDASHILAQMQGVSLIKLLNFSDVDAPVASGVVNAQIQLASQTLFGQNNSDINGTIDMNAHNIEIIGVDLDEDINILRNTNDIAIFKGQIPGVSLLSKTLKTPMRLAGLSEKKSHITQLNLQVNVVDSNASCTDCALKTKENRIAVNGNILLEKDLALEAFYVGLLLDNGCAYYKQHILGTLGEPEIQKAETSFNLLSGTVKSVVNVVEDGVRGVTSYLPGYSKVKEGVTQITPDALNKQLSKETCEPFYLGRIR